MREQGAAQPILEKCACWRLGGKGRLAGVSLPWPKVAALDQNVDAGQEAKETTEDQKKASEP